MKKYFTLVIIMLGCVTGVFGQVPCPTCPPTTPDLPIDSGIILLFGAAIALGIYKVMQNKKRQLEK